MSLAVSKAEGRVLAMLLIVNSRSEEGSDSLNPSSRFTTEKALESMDLQPVPVCLVPNVGLVGVQKLEPGKH